MPAQRPLAPTATGRPPSRLIRWETWELIVAVVLVAIAWVAAVTLPRIIGTDQPGRWFLESVIRNSVFVAVPVLLLIFKHRQPLLSTLVPKERAVSDFGWGLEIAIAVAALNVLAVKRALPALAQMNAGELLPAQSPYPWYYLGVYQISKMRELVLFVFGWGVFPPIGEEIFFRGFLFAALRRRLKAGYAIFLSALAFSLIHYPPGVSVLALRPTHLEPMIATLILGMIVATVYEYSGSILSPIMIHMGLNMSFVVFMAMKGELARLVSVWILVAAAVVFLFHFFISSKYLFRRTRT
jgi:membrane protease YdiL (CAAX protease family)